MYIDDRASVNNFTRLVIGLANALNALVDEVLIIAASPLQFAAYMSLGDLIPNSILPQILWYNFAAISYY